MGRRAERTDEEGVPFSSHLVELRRRFFYVLIGVTTFFTLMFALPAEYYVSAAFVIDYIEELAVVDGEKIRLTVINPMETFMTTMRVSFYGALVFAYPWTMFQAWRFVSPGLYPHERRFFLVAIPSAFVLFFAGAAFGRYVLLPISIPFLLGFNVSELDVQTSYTLETFLSLVFTLTFGLGFVFQIPLLVAPVVRFGLLSPEFFRKRRRYLIVISLIIGAAVSPTGNPLDMVLAGAPVIVLVEVGVALGAFWRKRVLKRAEREAREAAARGEPVDMEALAGGLAGDLEKKLRDFASGGARKFGLELAKGFRDAGGDARTVFDDDFDDEAPPVEVALRSQPRRKRPAAPSTVGTAEAPETEAAAPVESPAPEAPTAPSLAEIAQPLRAEAVATEEAPSEEAASPAAPAPGPAPEPAEEALAAEREETHWPDRPWSDGVNDEMATYVEDRIACRLDAFFEDRVRPLFDEIRALEKRLSGNGRAQKHDEGTAHDSAEADDGTVG